MKTHNLLLTCALSATAMLGTVATASAAHVSVVAARPATAGRLVPGNRYYGTGYRAYGYRYPYRYGYGYPYRYGYGYPYRYGYGYGYPSGFSIGIGYGYGGGYGYAGGGYGYAPYPAAYGPAVYVAHRPYWRPYRRVYWRRPVLR